MLHLRPLFVLLTFSHPSLLFFFFFNDTATTEIYTLSLHDALPICKVYFPRMALPLSANLGQGFDSAMATAALAESKPWPRRSEEHTSELQSLRHLVCRLLLEKKKKRYAPHMQRELRLHAPCADGSA